MDYRGLLDVTTELGYLLAMSGAETYRVEESITRIFNAYGENVEVFAIPNNLIVSLEPENGQPLTRMRRIGHHGNNMEAVEKYNNLSRRICEQKPAPEEAMQWLQETRASIRIYSPMISLLGHIIGGTGFILVYGGSAIDTLTSLVCALFAGLISLKLGKMKVNTFFTTIASAFVIALTAYLSGILGFTVSTDGAIISSLMLLVPGLVFTNAMRDIIYGDTNSGINRIVQVLLIGVAIALGTGAAWRVAQLFGNVTVSNSSVQHSLLLETVTTYIACCGFAVLFNIHGKNVLLGALGGSLTWVVYRILPFLGFDVMTACLCASVFAAAYAEIMARIRKQPAISYLVLSIIPLLPGAGVYRTTAAIMNGDMAGFSTYGKETIGIAGLIAVGVLISSTLARLWSIYQQKKSNYHH